MKWGALAVLALILVGLGFRGWEGYKKATVMHRSRRDPVFMAHQLDQIPYGIKFSPLDIRELLTTATGADPGDTRRLWRLTIPANGDTFVFEADSSVSSLMGSSMAWERKR
jgi:hypothetical protein